MSLRRIDAIEAAKRSDVTVDHPIRESSYSRDGRYGTDEVLGCAPGHAVAARYLDSPEVTIRERYLRIEAAALAT